MRLIFEADELGTRRNDIEVSFLIRDDKVDEADEEVFIVVLSVDESSLIAQTTLLGRKAALCRIQDNDGKKFCTNVYL